MSLRSVAAPAMGRLAMVCVIVIPALALGAPRARVEVDRRASPDAPLTGTVCSRGENRCLAHVRLEPSGLIAAAAAPDGLGPAELKAAYQIDPAMAKAGTVAIVDAYGYANLESDLATYRAQFGLPPCTRASGCLKVVNQDGATAPLPGEPPPDDDWTIETALDVDMASAACPGCKILVVQARSTSSLDLYTAQNAAAAARPSVISDSWGRAERAGENLAAQEPFFDHPGIAQFVSAGDSGYNEGGRGPAYPSTSAHVIAVGGTALTRSATARGWSEIAWTMGGSSCSLAIPRPAHQTTSPCAFRAAADIAAVGDPATGVAVYNAANGGWLVIGGTSAAAPLVAAIFAASGHGNATAAQIAQIAQAAPTAPGQAALFDVTSGSNGPCGNRLCNAGAGWDGPTGHGTPSAAGLAGIMGGPGGPGSGTLGVTITSPGDNATVHAGFTVTATTTPDAVAVGLAIDGTLLRTVTRGPYEFATPATLGFGPHVIQVAAADAQQNVVVAEVHVLVTFGGNSTGGGAASEEDTGHGGCRASDGQAPGSLAIAIAVVAVAGGWRWRRRRRA